MKPNPEKRVKFRLKIIRDLPGTNSTAPINITKKIKKINENTKLKRGKLNREGGYNTGRWQPDEHQRFIEAIMKYGNEWKKVQKHVGSRSSTQARSHAQKFFVKMKKANILDVNIDFTKNSIKSLHDLANNLTSDEYIRALKALNGVAFEKRERGAKKKLNRQNDDKMSIFQSTTSKLNEFNKNFELS
jgi:SHAQKYF class myb-like DNA-binding protein